MAYVFRRPSLRYYRKLYNKTALAIPPLKLLPIPAVPPQQVIPNIKYIGQGMPRTELTGATSYYISSTGSDVTGNGSPGTPWATIQNAINFISVAIDTGGFPITLNVQGGTFSGFGLKEFVGGGKLYIVGQSPSLTTVTNGPNDGTYNKGEPFSVYVPLSYDVYYNQLTLSAQTINTNLINLSDFCRIFSASDPLGNLGQVAYVGNILYSNQTLININFPGVLFQEAMGTNVTLTGTFNTYCSVSGQSTQVTLGANYTLLNVPTLNTYWATTDKGSYVYSTGTFSGSFLGTAKEYSSSGGAFYTSTRVPNGVSSGILTINGNILGFPTGYSLSTTVIVAGNGSTVVIPPFCRQLIATPGIALSLLTVDLPTSPYDGQIAIISTTKNITTLSVVSIDGTTVNYTSTALNAGQAISFVFNAFNNGWFVSA